MLRVRLLLLLMLLPLSAYADGAIDKSLKESAATASDIVPVNLGESAVELAGPWKFHVGDNPEWAQPDFDDSGWEDMDLNGRQQRICTGLDCSRTCGILRLRVVSASGERGRRQTISRAEDARRF